MHRKPRSYSSAEWDAGLAALHRAGIAATLDYTRDGYCYRLAGDSTLAQCRPVIESPYTAMLIADRRK